MLRQPPLSRRISASDTSGRAASTVRSPPRRRLGQALDLAAQAALDQAVEVKAVEVVRQRAHQEAIEDRPQRVVVRDLVGGAVQRRQRHLDAGAAGEEPPLVQDAEQRVQDRRVRLEDLVEEDDVGVGQHRLDAADVGALAEGLDVDRAEDLVRLGEARQQVLEVARVDQPGQVPHQRRLRGAGRTDDQHVLAGDQRDEQQADQLALVEVALVERRGRRRAPSARCAARRRPATAFAAAAMGSLTDIGDCPSYSRWRRRSPGRGGPRRRRRGQLGDRDRGRIAGHAVNVGPLRQRVEARRETHPPDRPCRGRPPATPARAPCAPPPSASPRDRRPARASDRRRRRQPIPASRRRSRTGRPARRGAPGTAPRTPPLRATRRRPAGGS